MIVVGGERKSPLDNLKEHQRPAPVCVYLSHTHPPPLPSPSTNNNSTLHHAPSTPTAQVCALLDMKPNVEDVNAALAMITEDLDERATVSDVRRLAGEQSKMLDSFSSELNVARWIWKSGKTKVRFVVLSHARA